jgi:hypothetical protein
MVSSFQFLIVFIVDYTDFDVINIALKFFILASKFLGYPPFKFHTSPWPWSFMEGKQSPTVGRQESPLDCKVGGEAARPAEKGWSSAVGIGGDCTGDGAWLPLPQPF